MKKSILLLLFVAISTLNFSFISDNEWREYKTIDGVIIYSKTANCDTEYNTSNNEYYVFKYVNTNNYNVRISWKLNLWNNGVCRSCNLPSPNEYELSVDLNAKQSIDYNCSDKSFAFKIFKSSPNGNINPEVKFEFDNLKVIKL